MNRPDLYFKTCTILINAYKNKTLFHANSETCALAHIIAANRGFSIWPYRDCFIKAISATWKNENIDLRWKETTWFDLLMSPSWFHRIYKRLKIGKENYENKKRNLQSTGYTWKEMKQISNAFDKCFDRRDVSKNILPALKNVIRELKQIHGVTNSDLESKYWAEFTLENIVVDGLPAEFKWIKKQRTEKYYTYKQFIDDRQEHLSIPEEKVSIIVNSERPLKIIGVITGIDR